MTGNDFTMPQPSPSLAVDGANNFQRMIHTAVRYASCSTERHPVILPIAAQSSLNIYVNNDINVSLWEDPWHFVEEISRSHANFVMDGSPSAAPNSMCLLDKPARIPHPMGNPSFDLPMKDAFRSGGVATDGRIIREDHIKRRGCDVSSAVSRNKDSTREKTISEAQLPWVPRIFQDRKLFMRVFPYEVQNIMHAFGEVRFCSVDVLEFMEDAARNITQRTALGVLSRFNTEKLTVRDISTCIRHDPRALHRLLFCLRRARQKGEDLHIVRPTHREWDSFLHYSTIYGKCVGEFPSMKHLERIPLVNIHKLCSEKARSMFWDVLGKLFKVQHAQCTQSYLTDRYSRCPTEGVGGRSRIDLFREWLSLPEHVQVTEGSLHALGNLAREAVGIITQTALVLKYQNRLAHSYERMLIDALGFGIGTGVLIPLSALQTHELLRLLNEIELVLKKDGNWSFRDGMQEGALEISHVREALRQLDDPEALAAHRPFWVGL